MPGDSNACHPIDNRQNSRSPTSPSSCPQHPIGSLYRILAFIAKTSTPSAFADLSGKVRLAYVLGSRQDEVFLKLKKLLEPFGIKKFYTDGLKTYERHLPVEMRQVSKYKMQRIERKHLTFRTRIKRLARKTICFSKSIQMHDLVIGLFINKYEFGVEI
ncbi:IS1 family transposase [Chroococcidiopsis sp. CCMEE 29]|uniref:IS1 family transposase n=1 Tax=Chroococcidiopsis sp. CCMEE 29 TaxID=155894 RepID=UPI0031F996CB